MSNDGISSAELGITAKDLGMKEKSFVSEEMLNAAHAKILRFDTPEYYAGYEEIKGKEPPTVTSFQSADGKQTLDLVGTQHTHQLPSQEVKDRMVARLDERFKDYIDKTASNTSKRLIMIEGASAIGVNTFQECVAQQDKMLKDLLGQNNITTEQEAVAKFGEMGAMIFAAKKENIPIMSPEPSPEEIITKQKKLGIPVIDIALKQAILFLDTYVHRGKLSDQKRFALDEVFSALGKASEYTGWQKELLDQTKNKLSGNPETDESTMRDFIDQVLPVLNARMQENQAGFNLVNPDYTWAFDPTNKDTYNHLHSPSSQVAVFNKMSNISGEFRDDYILDRIIDSVDEGKSPFIVYGDGHTIKLKPALSYLYPQVNPQ